MILFYMMAMMNTPAVLKEAPEAPEASRQSQVTTTGTSLLEAVSSLSTDTRGNVVLDPVTTSLATASSLTSGLATERGDVLMRRQSSQPQGRQPRDRDAERLLREVDELFVNTSLVAASNLTSGLAMEGEDVLMRRQPSQPQGRQPRDRDAERLLREVDELFVTTKRKPTSSAKTSGTRFNDDSFLKDIDDLLNGQSPASLSPPPSGGLQRREGDDDGDVNSASVSAPLPPPPSAGLQGGRAEDDEDPRRPLQPPSESLQVGDDVINPIPIIDTRDVVQDIFGSVRSLCEVDQSQIQEDALNAGNKKLREYFSKAYPWLARTLEKKEKRQMFIARIARSAQVDNGALGALDTISIKGLAGGDGKIMAVWGVYRETALKLFEANYKKAEADKKLADILVRPIVPAMLIADSGTFKSEADKLERIRKQNKEVIPKLISEQDAARLNFNKAEGELHKVVDIITGVHLIEFAKKKQVEAEARRVRQEGAAVGSPSQLGVPPAVELSPQQKLDEAEAVLSEQERVFRMTFLSIDRSSIDTVLDDIKQVFGNRSSTQEERDASTNRATKAVDDLMANNEDKWSQLVRFDGNIRDRFRVKGAEELQNEMNLRRESLRGISEAIKAGKENENGSFADVHQVFRVWRGFTPPQVNPNKIPPQLEAEFAALSRRASSLFDALNACIDAYKNVITDLIQRARASLRPVAPEGEAAVGSGSNLSAAAQPFVPGGAAGVPPKKDA